MVVSQQNIILFAAFSDYTLGFDGSNQIFATLALMLGIVYSVFALILANFRDQVVTKEVETISSLGSLKEFHMPWNNAMGGISSPTAATTSAGTVGSVFRNDHDVR